MNVCHLCGLVIEDEPVWLCCEPEGIAIPYHMECLRPAPSPDTEIRGIT